MVFACVVFWLFKLVFLFVVCRYDAADSRQLGADIAQAVRSTYGVVDAQLIAVADGGEKRLKTICEIANANNVCAFSIIFFCSTN
jgi:hypothetical protein